MHICAYIHIYVIMLNSMYNCESNLTLSYEDLLVKVRSPDFNLSSLITLIRVSVEVTDYI